MNLKQLRTGLDRRVAYKSVIRDLKKEFAPRCKEHAIGCFNCQVWRVIDDLQSIIELHIKK